jgi:hypothetical protein
MRRVTKQRAIASAAFWSLGLAHVSSPTPHLRLRRAPRRTDSRLRRHQARHHADLPEGRQDDRRRQAADHEGARQRLRPGLRLRLQVQEAGCRRTHLHKEAIKRAKKRSGRFSVKLPFFDYPEFWLNSPGTYYWQAHRIACEGGDISDCRQEGPIVKFKVG